MSAYLPGQYHVLLFDRIGSRAGKLVAESFTASMAAGEQAMQAGECHSFVVLRVLHNSLMPNVENYDADHNCVREWIDVDLGEHVW